MDIALRRMAMILVVLAVAVASAVMGYQYASNGSGSQIGGSQVGIDLLRREDKEPPKACYGSQGRAPEKNPNCPGGDPHS